MENPNHDYYEKEKITCNVCGRQVEQRKTGKITLEYDGVVTEAMVCGNCFNAVGSTLEDIQCRARLNDVLDYWEREKNKKMDELRKEYGYGKDY